MSYFKMIFLRKEPIRKPKFHIIDHLRSSENQLPLRTKRNAKPTLVYEKGLIKIDASKEWNKELIEAVITDSHDSNPVTLKGKHKSKNSQIIEY